MKQLPGILFFFLFLQLQVQAQRMCASQQYTQQLCSTNPAAKIAIEQAAKQVQLTLDKAKKYAARDTTGNELINIPVVVHVLYANAAQNISDAQILSQLTALNNDFAGQNADRVNTPSVFKNLAAGDVRIRFCLAQVDPKGKKTTGIIRKATNIVNFTADDAMKFSAAGGDDGWNSQQYLNIWVCGLGARSLGYATVPGTAADKDGVVIAYDVFGTTGTLRVPFNKGRTATHEVGHWLGIKHIWGDDQCGDDGVEDTPRQRGYNYGCPAFPRVTECSQDANGDMFMNYMDFSDDACMNMFTNGQKKRMRAVFASGNARNSFLTAFACDSTLVQPAPAIEPEPVVKAADAYKVYPNPVSGNMTIEYAPAEEFVSKSINIYNTQGTKVYSGLLNKEKSTVAMQKLVPGLYIVRIGEGKTAVAIKILKQ
jgi:hypothetical protein